MDARGWKDIPIERKRIGKSRVPHLSRLLRKVGFHERRSLGFLIASEMIESQNPGPIAARGAT